MKPDKTLTITGGSYRGRRLYAPVGVRPTSQRAREALMSKLVSLWGGPIQGYVADVCAGSGALGLEFLSRGAKHATFVDINTRTVQENLRLLTVPGNQYQLIQQDACRTLPPWPFEEPLDVLVTDPPYSGPPSQAWVNAWMHWLTPNHTLVCIEQETTHVCSSIAGLELIQTAVYGRATWTVWRSQS